MVVAFGGAESPEGDSLYAYPARESLWSPDGGAGPFARLSEHRSPRRRSFCSYKRNQNTLGAVPQDPLTLSCGWIRINFSATAEKLIRTAPQIRSQGACGAFYFGFCRDRMKNQPYKRRRVGRNLRLSRTDPALCSGQPSSLRCILLSPQGLATLRGPQLHGAYRRVTGL